MTELGTFGRKDLFLDNDLMLVVKSSSKSLDVCVGRVRKDPAGNTVKSLTFESIITNQDLGHVFQKSDLTDYVPGTIFRRGNGYCYITE